MFINKDRIKGTQWAKQAMDMAPLQAGIPCYCISYLTQKEIGESFGILILYFKKMENAVYFPQDRIDRLGKYYLGRRVEINNLYEGWKKIFEDLNLVVQKIRETNLEQLNNDDLLKLWQELFNQFSLGWIHSGFVEVYDNTSEQIIARFIENTNLSKNLKNEDKITLLEAEEMAIVQQERLDFVRLMNEIKENYKKYDKAVEKDPLLQRLINEHREKYYYMNANYGHAEEIKADEILKKVKHEYEKANYRLEEKSLLEIKKHYRNLKAEKDRIIHDYNIPKDLLAAFHYFSVLSDWRDKRKKMHQIGCVASQHIFDEIAHRNNIAGGLSKYLWLKDVEKSVVGLENLKNELESRAKESVLIIEDTGKFGWLFDIEARKIKDELDKTILSKSTKIIRGMSSYRGKITGIAKIINSTDAFHRFNHDDVLISSMTRVEFMPVVRKASAIVTDEGGITCHAAIVSRELEIPCIVGTRVATKIIKDGDFVEVDANEGIVRILKKAK